MEYADHRIAGTPLWDKCDLILQFIRDYVIGGEALRIRTDVENINGEKRPTHFKVKDYLKTNYKRDLI